MAEKTDFGWPFWSRAWPYYLVARAVCQIIFRELHAQGIRCSPETTPGSACNVDHTVSGELEFGIVQSDMLFAASKGIGRKPETGLRSVLSRYPELITVVARASANIHVLADLAGKRVAAGARTTWNIISGDLPPATPVRLTEPNEEIATALCKGTIDANFFVSAHPSGLVSKWLAACQTNFVAVKGPVVDTIVGKYPFFTRGFIATELYHVADIIPSFGPMATLVTSASSDPRGSLRWQRR